MGNVGNKEAVNRIYVCHMFKVCLKVGCSLDLFVCTVEKIVFYIQNCATSKQRKMR